MTGQGRISESELHAFVDGELSADEHAEIEALLAAGGPEQGLVSELRDLNDTLRARYASCLGEAVPPAMTLGLARLGRDRPGPVRPLLRPAAAIALLAASAASGYLARGFITQAQGPEAAFVATAMGAHTVYVPEVRHPVEVKADEAHLVRWLAKRVGADVRAPALAGAGWKDTPRPSSCTRTPPAGA
jgi:anti-sigma factor RsiW